VEGALEEGVMTFDRAWVLFFAWLPLAWLVFEWRRTARRLALALKAISFVAVLLALAEPVLSVNETKVALALLVDTSASVSGSDLTRASKLADDIQNARGRHWLRVIPFARSTRELDSSENQKTWKLRQTAGEPGRGTDLEGAIREAVAPCPPAWFRASRWSLMDAKTRAASRAPPGRRSNSESRSILTRSAAIRSPRYASNR
jgi:hypothetical protein